MPTIHRRPIHRRSQLTESSFRQTSSIGSDQSVSPRALAALPSGPKRYVAAKPLARFVPTLTKMVFQKFGFSSASLIAEWDNIVGRPLSEQCVPERLKWPRRAHHNNQNGETADVAEQQRAHGATLVLRTDAAYALEIEYASQQILERINAYFGYQAITALRLVQGPLATSSSDHRIAPDRATHRLGDPAQQHDCAQAISEIENAELREALERMSRGVFEGR